MNLEDDIKLEPDCSTDEEFNEESIPIIIPASVSDDSEDDVVYEASTPEPASDPDPPSSVANSDHTPPPAEVWTP